MNKEYILKVSNIKQLTGQSLASELRFQQNIFAQSENLTQQFNQQKADLENKVQEIKSYIPTMFQAILLGYLLNCVLCEFNDGISGESLGQIASEIFLQPFLTANDQVDPLVGFLVIVLWHTLLYALGFFIILVIIKSPAKKTKLFGYHMDIVNLTDTYNKQNDQILQKLSGHPKFTLPFYQSWYLQRLTEIVETGQANDIGTAVRILETRLSNERLERKIDQGIAASQRAEAAARDAEAAANDAAAAANSAAIWSFANSRN